jgi:putative membrane protein
MIVKTKFNVVPRTAILLLAVVSFALSCNETPKIEDTKDVAEEHNDAKYDNTTKEKDAQFLVNAAEIQLEEIQLGNLAQQKSKTKIVIDLANMMVESHTTSMTDLTALAKSKIVTIPSTPNDNANESYKRLNELTGKDFDKDYCKLMVDGHTSAVTLFEKASTEAVDNDIKAWASATLPVLRTHLDNAINCQKECEETNKH